MNKNDVQRFYVFYFLFAMTFIFFYSDVLVINKACATNPDSRILKGANFIKKTNVCASYFGEMTDITQDPADPNKVFMVGWWKMLTVKNSGEVIKTKPWAPRWGMWLKWVRLGNNDYYYNRDCAWGKPTLVDSNGKKLWTYGEKLPGANSMTAGDLFGDSKTEFVVGFNGDGGVHLLDDLGKCLWKKEDDNVWHVEVCNYQNHEVIVHSNANGLLRIRDAHGKILKELQPPVYAVNFSIVSWPAKNGQPAALLAGHQEWIVYSLEGKVLQRLPVGEEIKQPKPLSAWIHWGNRKGTSLAVMSDYVGAEGNSILALYDEQGNIQFEEKFQNNCGALAVIHYAGHEELWCGSTEAVYRYLKK